MAGNYGWNIREGFEGFDPKDKRALNVERPKKDKHGNDLIDPVLTYKNLNHPEFKQSGRAKGISITGGDVYTGKAVPALSGKYVFGDWSQTWAPGKGRLFAAERVGEKWSMADLKVAGNPDGMLPSAYVTAFGKGQRRRDVCPYGRSAWVWCRTWCRAQDRTCHQRLA